eukprot:SAG11_NODE_5064_length_1675_cov_18.774112_1_plen_106_part_00
MGVRATLVGGKGLKANRRCGRSTAGAVGAVEVGSGDQWEVAEILDDDFHRGIQYYHVQWVGGEVDWLPRGNLLPGAKRMLAAYDKAHGIEDGIGKKKKTRKSRRK